MIRKDFEIQICETSNGNFWYILTDLRTQDWWEDETMYPTYQDALTAANIEIDATRK